MTEIEPVSPIAATFIVDPITAHPPVNDAIEGRFWQDMKRRSRRRYGGSPEEEQKVSPPVETAIDQADTLELETPENPFESLIEHELHLDLSAEEATTNHARVVTPDPDMD